MSFQVRPLILLELPFDRSPEGLFVLPLGVVDPVGTFRLARCFQSQVGIAGENLITRGEISRWGAPERDWVVPLGGKIRSS